MAENTVQNGQTCLEKNGIESRHIQTVRSEYSKENPYGANHPNAISDGDSKGKGTGGVFHTFSLPDCNKPKGLFDYSNFTTDRGGSYEDIYGREGHPGRLEMINRSLYNSQNQYGPQLVSCEGNEGQIQINY